MAHPDRADLVVEMLSTLDRPVPVHYDPEGPPSGDGNRVWRVARAGWQLADPRSDFHLLIQDDALVVPDLLAGLERALDSVPANAVVSPYLGKGGATPARWHSMAAEADRRGASWVVSSKLMWGVGIILPTAAIPDMITHADRLERVPDDMRVAGWASRRHAEIWYTWPSLVDHRPVPSITKHHAKNRTAERLHQGSALDLDWTGPVVRDPMLTIMRGPRSGPRKRQTVISPTRTAGPGR